MRSISRVSAPIALGLLSIACNASADTLIVRNVHGYVPTGEQFAALIAVDGRIQRLLKADETVPPITGARVVDGDGKTLLPGLIDAHGHVLELGQQRLQADLRGSESVGVALDRVRAFAAANPRETWVRGRGWNQVLWADKQFPTAAQLDAAVADRPAMLTRVDGHAVWVNSLALKQAGITRATKNPNGGQIIRDSRGDPTGVLVDSATLLVERTLPAVTDADVEHALRVATTELASLGLTGVHDAGVDLRTYRAYQSLGQAKDLPIRIYAMLADGPTARPVIEKGPQPAQFEDRLQMRAIKAWVDGALGSRGAALLQDYSDQPGHRGLELYSRAQLLELGRLAAWHNWQLNIHAIGDAGNRTALNLYEIAFTAEKRAALRPRIEHAQVISMEDIPRFAELHVIASIQPTHATSDMNMAEDRVGPKRIQGAYAWRKLLDAKVRLAGGSDFPVELANPFHGLYAAVTRKSRDGKPLQGWYPQEKLTRAEALQLFSVDAAFAGHMEKVVGSLSPGQWADFILVDRDYFTVPDDEIDDIRVLTTYVAGEAIVTTHPNR